MDVLFSTCEQTCESRGLSSRADPKRSALSTHVPIHDAYYGVNGQTCLVVGLCATSSSDGSGTISGDGRSPNRVFLKEGVTGLAYTFRITYVHFGTRYIPGGLAFRGNPDSNAGEIQNACFLPQRDKCAVAPITASSNVPHIVVGMRRDGGCLVQLRPDGASGAACLNPMSDGDERVQYDDLVLCYRVTVCTK